MTDQLLDRAIEFAAVKHRGQRRDGDSPLPYITHPIDVLINLRYIGGVIDEPSLCAAALHDVVEECGVEFAEIDGEFGAEVEALVKELTRYEPTEEEKSGLDKDQIWQLRSDLLLKEIAKMSPRAQAVKLADRYSNLVEAERVKTGKKLARYKAQSKLILEIIPKSVNPGLWTAIRNLL